MNYNQYESFKQGIKTDIKYTGASLFFFGGLILLIGILFSFFIVAIQDEKMDSDTRLLLGTISVVVTSLLIFNKTMRIRIVQGWILLLVAIPILLMLYVVGALFYIAIFKSV